LFQPQQRADHWSLTQIDPFLLVRQLAKTEVVHHGSINAIHNPQIDRWTGLNGLLEKSNVKRH